MVLAVDDRRHGGLPMEGLLECRMRGVRIIEGASFYERETRKVALEMITPGWLVFSEGFSLSTISRLSKRLIDMLAALVLLAVTWPFMLLTAIAIKLEDGLRAPVLYSQERVGLNGRIFRVHKFRSMRTDAETGGVVWAQKDDDRITRVGHVIRKVRIDELPQIFSVLKGEMAFFGPRPECPVFVEQLSESIPSTASAIGSSPDSRAGRSCASRTRTAGRTPGKRGRTSGRNPTGRFIIVSVNQSNGA